MKIEIKDTTVTAERDCLGMGASHYRVTVRAIVNDKELVTNNQTLPYHVVFSDVFDEVVGEMKTALFLEALKRHSNNLVRLTNGR